LMRYKSPMLPFLTVLIASYWDVSKVGIVGFDKRDIKH